MKKTLGLHAGIWIIIVIIIITTIMYFTKQNNNIQPVPVATNGVPSIVVPSDYKIDSSYIYQALGPGKDILGTKFTIPDSIATGTNLSNDSYISLEQIPLSNSTTTTSSELQKCSASLFLNPGVKPTSVVDSGITYSFASSSDAGAGNRYDETVYAVPGTNPCIAVRYFIHYGAFENYPEGSIVKFNEQEIINKFDKIRQTLIFK